MSRRPWSLREPATTSRALPDQGLGDGQADALARTGNHRDRVLEPQVHGPTIHTRALVRERF